MSNETGGPAFPILAEQAADGWAHVGMTLRDYFAAKAMQGMCSISSDSGALHWTVDGIAESAYAQADAMLEARK